MTENTAAPAAAADKGSLDAPARATTKAVKASAKAQPEAAEKPRKTPATSGKPKLKWTGDVAKAEGVEIGKRVETAGGSWQAVVKDGGKNKILAVGVSRDRAYAVVTRWHHYGEVPVVKAKKAEAKKTA